MRFPLAIALSLLAGCTLFHDDNSDRTLDGGLRGGGLGDDGCSGGGGQQELLLNPSTLACIPFGTGSQCDPSSCDSCPEFADAGATVLPPWGSCQSSCIGRDEASCSLSLGCRVTKEANRYFVSGLDPYLGCFPVNREPIVDGPDCAQLDADTCSSLERCWAVYDAPSGVQCGIEHAESCPSGAFVACVNVGATLPGRCGGDLTVTCSVPAPICPGGTQPGINDNCYTGICIPSRYCAVPD